MYDPNSSPELTRAFRTLSVCLDREPTKMSRTEAQKIFEWMRVAQNTDGDQNPLFRQANRTYVQLVTNNFVEDDELTASEVNAFRKAETGSSAGAGGCLVLIAIALIVSVAFCLWFLFRK